MKLTFDFFTSQVSDMSTQLEQERELIECATREKTTLASQLEELKYTVCVLQKQVLPTRAPATAAVEAPSTPPKNPLSPMVDNENNKASQKVGEFSMNFSHKFDK